MDLYKHQTNAINFILDRCYRGNIFYEMGLGKTRCALEIYKHFKFKYPNSKMITISPICIMESGWGDDIKKFTEFKYVNTKIERGNKKDPEHLKADIFLFNYEALTVSKDMIEWFINISSSFTTMLVLDESSRIKSNKSKITKFLLANKKLFGGIICMSGTPAPNSEIEFFPQMALIAPDISVFRNYYAYQAKYFNLVRGNQTASAVGNMSQYFAQGFKIKCNPLLKNDLFEEIKKYAIFAKKKDCIDLPKKIFLNRYVDMGFEQRRIYNSINKELWVELKNETQIATQTALTKLMKLRQITSGFLYDEIGETHHFDSSKLDMIWEVIDEIGPDEQVVIFAQFKEEIKVIVESFKLKGKTIGFLNSETLDRDKTIEDFKSSNTQYLICHPKSAGMGLNFQHNSSNMIWYSLSYSYAEYIQACDRIHRIGQDKSCNYVHLVCKDSIDETLLKVLANKGEANDFVFEYMKGNYL